MTTKEEDPPAGPESLNPEVKKERAIFAWLKSCTKEQIRELMGQMIKDQNLLKQHNKHFSSDDWKNLKQFIFPANKPLLVHYSAGTKRDRPQVTVTGYKKSGGSKIYCSHVACK